MNEEIKEKEAGEMKDKTEIELEEEIEVLDKEHSVIHNLYSKKEFFRHLFLTRDQTAKLSNPISRK